MSTHPARRAAGAARTTAGAARRHPREAASLVGVVAVGSAVLGLVVTVKLVRSRRVRRRVEASARRGAFGPGVAAASVVERRLRDDEAPERA